MAARGEFRFLEDIAPADAAFEATGETLEEIFEASARALFSIIVDIECVETQVTQEVSLEAESAEALLYAWLSELVYLKDVKKQLYSDFHVAIELAETMELKATAAGDAIANLLDRTLTDVKAITYHKLAIEETDQGLKATVVVDL